MSESDIAQNEKTAAQAAALYGNPGGSPGAPGNIDTALGAAFGPVVEAARGDRNHELAREIAGARSALGKEMLALGFSDNSAKELGALLGEYYNKPRDKDQMESNLDKALDELSTEWGADFAARFEGANKVLASLIRGNPGLADFLHSTGLSRDVRFLRLAGEIAKHHPVAQAAKRPAWPTSRKPSGTRTADVLYGGKKR
jgi:hypothetical protein